MSRGLVLLLTATASFAREASRARYAQGLELSTAGRDVEAREEFQAVLAASPAIKAM
jgi:hypothetical protein